METRRGIIGFIDEYVSFRSLMYELVNRDIKVKYRRSVLGLLWTLLVPIFTMLVMTVVFSQLFRFEIENYVVYLLCGNILFGFFSEGVSTALRSIVEGSHLLKKVYIPKTVFPTTKVMSSAINLLFSYVALFIVMIVTGTPFQLTLLLIPVLTIYIFIFTLGMGMILASITVFFRDIIHLFNVIVTLWMYATPIFYPESLLGKSYPFLLTINPMYHYIHYLRMLVLEGQVPSVSENGICFLMGIVLLFIGLASINRNQDKYILYI